MFDPKATYDVLDPKDGDPFGKITAGIYADLKHRAGRELGLGQIRDLKLINGDGTVLGHIEGDTLVQTATGVLFPLRLHQSNE